MLIHYHYKNRGHSYNFILLMLVAKNVTCECLFRFRWIISLILEAFTVPFPIWLESYRTYLSLVVRNSLKNSFVAISHHSPNKVQLVQTYAIKLFEILALTLLAEFKDSVNIPVTKRDPSNNRCSANCQSSTQWRPTGTTRYSYLSLQFRLKIIFHFSQWQFRFLCIIGNK